MVPVCQMTPLTPPHDRRGFEIAIICALPLEAECVQCVFDRCWEDEGIKYRKDPGDPNAYTTGVIGEHNVVLAHMPGTGKVSASGVAAYLRISFPRVKLALVVGVCGGVPYDTESQEEVRLGDIVICQALVQYDFGKKYPEKFAEKITVEEILGRPSLEIRSSLAQLKTFQHRKSMQRKITTYLENLQAQLPQAKYPDPGTDRLYEPSYLHKHHESVAGVPCGHCAQGAEQICPSALRMNCDELGCKENSLVSRKRLTDDHGLQPVVHFGKMGSGDTVMKSGEDRDRLAKADGIIAFEMEGAGVWDHFPSIVIKGVSDYADSHKNNQWQSYAAATAAACMKAFLMEWTAKEKFPQG
jgi:nucleoside phosphorylase